ncbi:hypothetical protein F5Y04DRAFT_278919 [Hypomontagnella monticulosa]|nr:hypothetical protein F5Y04DRAFT_278919 [Hypomontagnella monticulosa]
MNSVATVFHFFPFLPFELRREIYILATPPRVVHVRESWDFVGEDAFWDCYDNSDHDYEDFKLEYAYHSFEDRYKANPLRVKIHPDIAYFARNWRDRIPRELRRPLQTCPESFGSTSNAASSGPWIPTEETPEIPLCWLEEDLCAAFELVRESHLYSQAPIPPLLHT